MGTIQAKEQRELKMESHCKYEIQTTPIKLKKELVKEEGWGMGGDLGGGKLILLLEHCTFETLL